MNSRTAAAHRLLNVYSELLIQAQRTGLDVSRDAVSVSAFTNTVFFHIYLGADQFAKLTTFTEGSTTVTLTFTNARRPAMQC